VNFDFVVELISIFGPYNRSVLKTVYNCLDSILAFFGVSTHYLLQGRKAVDAACQFLTEILINHQLMSDFIRKEFKENWEAIEVLPLLQMILEAFEEIGNTVHFLEGITCQIRIIIKHFYVVVEIVILVVTGEFVEDLRFLKLF